MNVLTKVSVGIVAVMSTLLWCTSVGEARERLPLVELDKQPKPAPAGYQWYIVRDWQHVYAGKALGVARGETTHPTFAADELIFKQSANATLHRRRPRSPGEISHILLPVSFQLPPDVAALTVGPPPVEIPPKQAVDPSSMVFREEPLPPGTPAGYKAYTFVHPGLVYAGTATSLQGDASSFVLSGPDLTVRRAQRPGEASHVLLPAHIVLPAATLRRPN